MALEEEKDEAFDIVDLVGRHFLESNASQLIDEWIKKHCLSFSSSSATEEHTLEQTSLHEEFKKLYEETVESEIIENS